MSAAAAPPCVLVPEFLINNLDICICRSGTHLRGLVDIALAGAPLEVLPLLLLVCRIANRSPFAAQQV